MANVEVKPFLNPGDVINGRYKVTTLLGQGGFGAVFKVYDEKKNEIQALKVELKKPKEDEPGLRLEIGVLKRMQSNSHFVRFIDGGQYREFCYLVMQLVGKNLGDLRKSSPMTRFTLSTSLRLSVQCLEAIEAMHNSGLLHRDIKPANFAMGNTSKDLKNVYMLDFGLVRRYRMKDGKIRKPRPSAGFRGTVKYASLNCHKRLELGRHDDLWSWLFMMIEFIKGELPWKQEPDRDKVGDIKENRTDKLLSKLPKEIPKMYNSITKLSYTADPKYDEYRITLEKLLKRKKLSTSDPFDWEEGGQSYREAKSVCDQPYRKQMGSKRKVILEEIKDKSESEVSDVSGESER